MIWFGVKATEMPELTRAIMVGIGVGTILYNASTYYQSHPPLSRARRTRPSACNQPRIEQL